MDSELNIIRGINESLGKRLVFTQLDPRDQEMLLKTADYDINQNVKLSNIDMYLTQDTSGMNGDMSRVFEYRKQQLKDFILKCSDDSFKSSVQSEAFQWATEAVNNYYCTAFTMVAGGLVKYKPEQGDEDGVNKVRRIFIKALKGSLEYIDNFAE